MTLASGYWLLSLICHRVGLPIKERIQRLIHSVEKQLDGIILTNARIEENRLAEMPKDLGLAFAFANGFARDIAA